MTLRSQPCSAVQKQYRGSRHCSVAGLPRLPGLELSREGAGGVPIGLAKSSPAQPSPSQAKPSPSQAKTSQAKLPAHLLNHFFEHLQHLGQVATRAVGCSKGHGRRSRPRRRSRRSRQGNQLSIVRFEGGGM